MTANAPAQLGKLATVTTSGAVAAGKHSSFNAASGALTATLPALTTGAVAAALTAGQIVRAKVSKSKADTSANTVTVTCAGSDTFEGGSPTQTLTVPGEKLTVFAAIVPGAPGATWIVEEHTAPRDTLDNRYLSHDQQVIDLNTKYGVNPGDDITTALQSAFDLIGASGKSGRIFITKVGNYVLGGALKTGSYTGSAGTGAGQGGGVTYTWNGQVLLPAIPFTNSPAVAITLEGIVPPTRSYPYTGASTGVTITSAITAGAMIDTRPGSDGWGNVWTGVALNLRNLIFSMPDNPTATAVAIGPTLRADWENVIALTATSWTDPTAGSPSTNPAFVLPQAYENGDVSIRNCGVRGFPSAFRITEHATFDTVQIYHCQVGFISIGGGHPNHFTNVDVEEVRTIFLMESGSTLVLQLTGTIAIDSASGAPWNYTLLYDDQTGNNLIRGDLMIEGVGASPGIGTPSYLLNVRSSSTDIGHAGWQDTHIYDTFARRLPGGTTGAPGLASMTMHPWRLRTGTCTITAIDALHGKLAASAAGANVELRYPVLRGLTGGTSRRIKAVFTTGATGAPNFGIVAGHAYNTGTGIWFVLKSATLTGLAYGGFPTATGFVNATVATVGASTTVTLELELEYRGGIPVRATGYVNGVRTSSLRITKTQGAAMVSATRPYVEDGVTFQTGDGGAVLTQLSAVDVPSSGIYNSGTATLAAGTVSVPDVDIAATSVVRLNRQTAGGTLGQLSVALTPGTGFAINSSSNTETSTVFWEVVTY